MGNIYLVLIDLTGMMGFLIALYFSYLNYRKTGHATLIWLLVGYGMALGALFSFFNMLLWAGFYKDVMEQVTNSIFLAEAIMLTCAAFVSVKHRIKPI